MALLTAEIAKRHFALAWLASWCERPDLNYMVANKDGAWSCMLTNIKNGDGLVGAGDCQVSAIMKARKAWLAAYCEDISCFRCRTGEPCH